MALCVCVQCSVHKQCIAQQSLVRITRPAQTSWFLLTPQNVNNFVRLQLGKIPASTEKLEAKDPTLPERPLKAHALRHPRAPCHASPKSGVRTWRQRREFDGRHRLGCVGLVGGGPLSLKNRSVSVPTGTLQGRRMPLASRTCGSRPLSGGGSRSDAISPGLT